MFENAQQEVLDFVEFIEWRKNQKEHQLSVFSDQAPLGRGVGYGVWGVGEEIAPTTAFVTSPIL
ncbi:MAG: hypothetical protein KME31_01255 [Tolypothrix carrinoi HA7290-LM1]|jgi:hypothetical protein|nr:hypothetical protein [Tolypothrix carrinoi HA7290-LM1]